MKQKIYEVDSIDGYNKWYGVETLHPLVTVIDIKESPEWLNGATLRYYNRQFITRHKVNSDILTAFHQQLREYFVSGHPERNGLPTVYFLWKTIGICLAAKSYGGVTDFSNL